MRVTLLSISLFFALICFSKDITFLRKTFYTTDSLLSLNGASSIDNNILYLNKNTTSQIGSAFLKKKLTQIKGFSTYFEFKFDAQSYNGADGMTFVIAKNTNKYGTSGRGIGYQGIEKSVNVEFDSYSNSNDAWEMSASHVSVNVNGNDVVSTQPITYKDLLPTFNFNSSTNIYHTWIDYDNVGKTLYLRLSLDSIRPSTPILQCTIDLTTYATNEYYVGFTAATGADYENHKILKWYFNADYISTGILPGDDLSEDHTPPTVPKVSTYCDSLVLYGSTDNSGIDHYEYRQMNDDWIIAQNAKFEIDTSLKVFYRSIDKQGNSSVIDSVILYGEPKLILDNESKLVKYNSSVDFEIKCSNITACLWYKNGFPLKDSFKTSIHINKATFKDTGYYYCSYSNPCKGGISKKVYLRIKMDTIIVKNQTKSIQACTGNEVNFKVSAKNVSAYQWTKNGNILINQTDSILNIKSLQPYDTGLYVCEMSNDIKNKKSEIIRLSVYERLQIKEMPQSWIKMVGESFSVALNPVKYISCQWFKNNKRINSDNPNSFTINSVSYPDAADYSCKLKGFCDSVVFRFSIVVVENKSIFSSPASTQVCIGGDVQFKVDSKSGKYFQWKKDGVKLLNGIDSILTVYNVDLEDLGNYSCVVTKNDFLEESSVSTLSAIKNPKIRDFFIDYYELGNSIQIEAAADGTDLQYVWTKNDMLLSNADSSIIVLDSINYNTDVFKCKVSNVCGSYEKAVVVPDIYQHIDLFPNPTNSGFTYIKNDFTSEYQYQIYDIYGNLIKQEKKITEKFHKINFEGWKNGLYFIKINSVNGISKKLKVVISQ